MSTELICRLICRLSRALCCARVRYKRCATQCGVLLWCAMSCVLRCAVSCVLRCAVGCALRCAVSCVVCSQFKLPRGGLWEDLADQYAFHADRRSIDHSHYLLWYPDSPTPSAQLTQHPGLCTQAPQHPALCTTYCGTTKLFENHLS